MAPLMSQPVGCGEPVLLFANIVTAEHTAYIAYTLVDVATEAHAYWGFVLPCSDTGMVAPIKPCSTLEKRNGIAHDNRCSEDDSDGYRSTWHGILDLIDMRHTVFLSRNSPDSVRRDIVKLQENSGRKQALLKGQNIGNWPHYYLRWRLSVVGLVCAEPSIGHASQLIRAGDVCEFSISMKQIDETTNLHRVNPRPRTKQILNLIPINSRLSPNYAHHRSCNCNCTDMTNLQLFWHICGCLLQYGTRRLFRTRRSP
ncbi:predicted protein [Histoplasma capsulatum var. duboisii H88]|uniref:Predicted protein n=2 Tax=Ajellomyces capsulatus TaxID=5037 RepID=F0UVK7_AJEC8|nr:predicted protein [Histoplasma capsulatum H143]EGC49934.1 predicted protein [Histoplasma capsulatum var. duboisii H88]